MNPMDTRQHDDSRDEEPRKPAAEPAQSEPRPPTQAERAVMHPDQDDLDWRYFLHAWHS